jgi:ABC-type glycerol-3-phosphate transport system substrate-binding protein
VELHYVTSRLFGNVEDVLIKAFEAEHPNIKLTLMQRRQAALNYLTDPIPPDLLIVSPGEALNSAIDQGLLADISDVWEQTDLANSYPAAFQALSERNGKQFFLPLAYAWNAVYYNKQIFARYNLQPPQTWDQLMQICDTLYNNGETPFVLSGNDRSMSTLWLDYLDLRLNGVAFHHQLSTGQLAYDKEAGVRTVFELWRSLIERGYFLPESRTLDQLSSLIALVRNEQIKLGNSKAVMALSGPVFLDDLPDPLRQELDFFPFPSMDPSIPTAEPVYVVGFVIPANAPQRLAALEFLTFLNSPAARAIVTKDISVSHLYVPAFANAETAGLPHTVQQGMRLVQNAQELTTPYTSNIPRTQFASLTTFLRELLTPPQNAQDFDLNAALQKLEAARTQTTVSQ